MADGRTYIKVHDGMYRHPKIAALSDRAFRALVAGWCYCSEYLTDGVIVWTTWSQLVPGSGTRRGPEVVQKVTHELVVAALIVARDDEVHFHDYLDHQRSKAQVEHVRKVRAEAGKQGGRPPKAKQNASNLSSKSESRKNPVTEELLCNSQTESVTNLPDEDSVNVSPDRANEKSRAQDSSHVSLATTAVAGIVGASRPRAIREGLIKRAVMLLDDGALGCDLTEGLMEWRKTADARITWLDHKVGDAASRREAAARPPQSSRPSTTDQRVAAVLALKANICGTRQQTPGDLFALPGGAA